MYTRSMGSVQPVTQGSADPVRLRILEGAASVFGRHGYGATSVEMILEEAGVSRRTFYKAFRSKEDVLVVLFENAVDRLLSAVRKANEVAGPSEAPRVIKALEAYIRVHADAGPLARVLLLEQFSPGSPLSKQRDAAMAEFSKLISGAYTRAGQQPPDPILVHGVVAAINQIAVRLSSEYPTGDWDVERAKRVMLRMLTVLDAG